MEPVLRTCGLEVVYHTRDGKLKALHDVSFEVQPGEIVGLVGESGCGKSTVASAILRLLPPNGQITAGELRFKNRNLLAYSPKELRHLRGRDIAMVFQDPMTSLNPVFTVGEQMIDVQKAHPADGQRLGELRQRAIAMLQRVSVPDAAERIDHYPHQFSGGLRQRILIAMALLSRPALLIADEPTSALDVTIEVQVLELLKELRTDYDTSILFVSHDLGVIAQVCDRVVVMYAGRVVEQGDVFSLYQRPLHPYTQALLASVPSRLQHGKRLTTIPGRVPSLSALPPGCEFSDRCRFAAGICRLREPDPYPADGRLVRCHAYEPGAGFALQQPAAAEAERSRASKVVRPAGEATTPVAAPVLVQLTNVAAHFNEKRGPIDIVLFRPPRKVLAVDGVSLEIRRGEVIGLVGESGCGKTTLAKTILGLIPATGGRVAFAGKDIATLSPAEIHGLRANMQMIFQDPISSLSPRLKVSYLLTEPYRIHRTPRERRSSLLRLLQMVGLSDEQREKYPHQLSGGQARRVGIARALTLRPAFIAADEPTSGLDVSVAAGIINLMKDLATEYGLTYLIVSHNLNVVGYIADRTAVMYLGHLVEVGPTRQLFDHPVHPYTMALLSSISEPDPTLRGRSRRLVVQGEIPSPQHPPSGCRFHTRCPFADETCKITRQALVEIEPERTIACHRWEAVREIGWPAASHGQDTRVRSRA